MIYETLAASFFATFALLFIARVKNLNIFFLGALALFPAAVIVSGEAVESFIPQLIAGAVLLFAGFILMATAGIGGGVAKGLAVIGLWIPVAYLYSALILIAMSGGVYAALHGAALKGGLITSNRLEHFAALMFAVAAAVLYFKVKI